MIYRSMTLKGCTIPKFKLNGILCGCFLYTNVNHCPKFYDDIFAAMSSEQASTAVREAHCAQATVARLVTFESLKWKKSSATNSTLFIKLGSLLYVRCLHRSAKSTAVSNKTFLFQVTNIYLFCGSVTLST